MGKRVTRSARTGAFVAGRSGGAFRTKATTTSTGTAGPWAIRDASTGRFVVQKRSGDVSRGKGSED